jgi:glycine betaine/proline transport system permease protein
MTTVLAQQETTTTTTSDGPGFLQNSWLDDYEFHFGEWIKQIVDWTDQNLGWLLDAFIWPFEFLFNLLMSPDETATSIMSLPWYWVGIIFFIIGSITRNTRVGIMVGSLVVACGLLGPDYWSETTKTFGLVFVSVFLCAIIGIPLGVLCGRVDAVWNAVRPVLDAMQVIHAFVYMLPFIFFWGPGEASATMATLVFALPPLVRLTNLGVRQVPSDVVEASRAFGASEMRVLTDVQLPLARPAILTGLNQTLLMAIGMLGIAAIMGAGGLGKLLLQAIASNNIPQATSAGLAYFFVAIVADRISQRESSDGLGLFGRIQEAWTYRADPEGLLAAQAARLENADSDVVTQAEAIVDDAASVIESEAPVNSVERLGLLIGFGGLAVAAVSAFLTWSNDSGLASAWGRAADVDVLPNGDPGLLGRSFSGIEASGGTLFAVFVLGLSVLGLFCAARPLLSFPGAEGIATQSRRLQGALITFIVAIGVAAWLANIFNGDMSAWLDGAGYNRIATAILLVAAIAGGEWIGRYLMGRTGLFIGAFAVAIVLWIVLGADRLSAIGVLAFAMVALALGVEAFVLGMPRLGADGMLILALGALGSAVGYFMLNEAPLVTAYSHGIGVYVALIGTAAAVVGGLMAVFAAPYTSRIPLKLDIKWSLIGGAAIALIAMFASLIAPWQSDARLDSLLSQEEIDAETARLTAEAGDDVNKQIAAAQEITNFINAAQSDPVQVNGIESGGPLIGWPTLAFSGAAVAMTVLAAGALGGDESRRWRFGTLVTGLGLAAMIIPAAWIFSFTRSAEPRAITGNGAFFTMVLAFIFIAIGRGVINDFRRRKIYSDMASAQSVVDVTDDPAMAGSAGA